MYSGKVIPILKESGKELKKFFGRVEVVGQKSKSPADVVTELDLKIEKFIAGRLAKIFPDIEYVGEELGGNDGAERFWLVDPLDATSHYVRGIPFCTTMIALVESGKIVFSAIHDFIRNEIFYAERGQTAKMNGQSIRVSNRKLDAAYLVYEINFHKNKKRNWSLFLNMRKKCIWFKTVSCGYEFALIAQGKIEGRIMLDPYGEDHDYAPGAFLVAQAGGKVRNIGKKSYDYKNHNFIAVNPLISKDFKRFYGV